MATFSKKFKGKEIGDAAVYAKPHTMSGKAVGMEKNPGKEPNLGRLAARSMSVGNISTTTGDAPAKTSGIKIRGIGAAERGVMARGPMA